MTRNRGVMNRMGGQLRLYGIVILSISFFFLRGGGEGQEVWERSGDLVLGILNTGSCRPGPTCS